MPTYRVTTVVYEYHFVEAVDAEAAEELACELDADSIDVTQRYAELVDENGLVVAASVEN